MIAGNSLPVERVIDTANFALSAGSCAEAKAANKMSRPFCEESKVGKVAVATVSSRDKSASWASTAFLREIVDNALRPADRSVESSSVTNSLSRARDASPLITPRAKIASTRRSEGLAAEVYT